MFHGVWVALLLFAAGAAHADPIRIDAKPGTCDLAQLRTAVAALAPDATFDETATRVVHVEGASDAPSARIWFDDGHGDLRGPRIVTAASCSDLVDSAALVIAMELPKPSAQPAPEVEALPEPDEATAPPRPRVPFALDVFAGGALTTSGSHEQAAIGARWRRGSRSVAASLRRSGDETLPLTMGEVQIGRTDVALEPCVRAGGLDICALAGGGVIHGTGQGLLRARAVVSPIAFLGTALGWEHAVAGPISVRIHAEAAALLTTTELDVDDMPVWTSSRLEAAGGLAVLVHIP